MGHVWGTQLMRIATLKEFVKNDRFFTTSRGPNIGHTIRDVSPKKEHKGWFLQNMSEVRIKEDKMFKD